jgi:2'-5' RNA ligase
VALMAPDSALRAVVAFPTFDVADRQFVESIRAKHDPEARRIAPHFTLVFPAILPLRDTEAHIARVAQSTEPLRFVLRRAAVVPDHLGTAGHIFLLPEDGRDALTGLHDRLNQGMPQPQWKRGAPFTPHVTVAAATTLDPLHALAGELNARSMNIRGSVSAIVLVEVTMAEIRQVAHFDLGAAV